MKWAARIWHSLIGKLQRYDGDGMNGLWLVSPDLKHVVNNLSRSRDTMHQAQRINRLATHRLNRTIDHLKVPPPPFRIDSDDNDRNRP